MEFVCLSAEQSDRTQVYRNDCFVYFVQLPALNVNNDELLDNNLHPVKYLYVALCKAIYIALQEAAT
jgi:hypothetical protein